MLPLWVQGHKGARGVSVQGCEGARGVRGARCRSVRGARNVSHLVKLSLPDIFVC